MLYKNPIIRGFNPDPSICRVGDDFYLITSTFEFFPGIPIYHSKNLINWELISYCLTNSESLPLNGCIPSGGLYAPTIRYNNGTFYMICTNMMNVTNFIVHTNDIYGKWSKPVTVDNVGIDPSLFFDDDGKCYFSGTVFDGDSGEIAIAQINPITGELLTEKHFVTGCGGKAAEAPHIYKHHGYYYLMLAEGGTEYGHMVTVQRSKNVFGNYEKCPHNPILSHKDKHGIIQATGHADITDDKNGNLWAVCLGIRANGFLHNLGRETFLSPAEWTEDNWLKIGINNTIDIEMDGPLPAKPQPVSFDFNDDFSSDKIDIHWTYLRNPELENYILNNGKLILKGTDKDICTRKSSPTFMGIRQSENNIDASVKIKTELNENSKTGLTAYYNQDYHYAIYLTQTRGQYKVCLNKAVHDINVITDSAAVDYSGEIEFKITADKDKYYFYYKTANDWCLLGTALTAGLSTEGTYYMTFTGTFIGIYAVNCSSEFEYFKLKTKENKI